MVGIQIQHAGYILYSGTIQCSIKNNRKNKFRGAMSL